VAVRSLARDMLGTGRTAVMGAVASTAPDSVLRAPPAVVGRVLGILLISERRIRRTRTTIRAGLDLFTPQASASRKFVRKVGHQCPRHADRGIPADDVRPSAACCCFPASDDLRTMFLAARWLSLPHTFVWAGPRRRLLSQKLL